MVPAGVFTEEGAYGSGRYLPRAQCAAVPWTLDLLDGPLWVQDWGPQWDLLRPPSESWPRSPWII